MTSTPSSAFDRAAEAIPFIVERFDRAIEEAGVALSAEQASDLHRKAFRSRFALADLDRFLSRKPPEVAARAGERTSGELPALNRAQAGALVRELDAIALQMEAEIFVPLMASEIGYEDLREAMFRLGEAWACLIHDLRKPLQRQHPELNRGTRRS